ncbi:MAG TPA: glycosyltransferase, partial [Thermoanaerobaculia bacterium]|nr:glycosyltransferase [Thermoanaerobaculia bacterium]
MNPDLSVVFPVFNEEENIPILLDEIAAALRGEPWTYEMVAVNDGSRDRSLEILHQSKTKYPNLRVLTFEKNSGQTAALDAAWRAAHGKYVVSLDADLQNDPADIPKMMRELERAGADMVIGVRVNRQDTWSRKMQS